MAQPTNSVLSLRDVYQAIFRHKRLVSLTFLSVMGCTVLATALSSRAYRSEGKLFVRLGRENSVLDPTATLGQGSAVAAVQSRENEINSVAELLSSRGLLEKVVDAIGPEVIAGERVGPAGPESSSGEQARDSAGQPRAWHASPLARARQHWRRLAGTSDLGSRDRAILKLGKQIHVDPVRRSNIVQVSCEARTPEAAQAVVSKLIELYLEEHLRVNRAHRSREFFTAQAAQLREELSRAEGQLRDLKNETGLVSPAEQREILVTRMGRLEDDLLKTTNEIAAEESRSRQLHQTLATLPEEEVTTQVAGFTNEGTDAMRGQFYALQLAEQEARAKYTPHHPKLQELARQVDEARRILQREDRSRTQTTTAQPKVFVEMRSALARQEPVMASLRARAGKLEGELGSLRGELKRLSEHELQIARLQREVDLKDASYRKYGVNLEQARIDQALEAERMSNISVAQPATFEPRPIRPRVAFNLALGLALSFLAGLGLALFSEAMDHSLRTPEDIEQRLDLPALASIPRFRVPQHERN